MAKIGRNQPCPCGSGKKYKLCCLSKDQARHEEAPAKATPPPRPAEGLDEDELEQLDARSNHVVDLIREGRLDEAEAAAQELLRRFPGFMDGHLRLGMVYEARKKPDLAADQYRKAAACLGEDGEDLRADLLRQADELSRPA